MKGYIYRITLIGIAVFMISCSSTEQKTAVTAPPVKVVVRKVVAYSGTNFLSVSGKIQASKSADISTSMMGYVTNVCTPLPTLTLVGYVRYIHIYTYVSSTLHWTRYNTLYLQTDVNHVGFVTCQPRRHCYFCIKDTEKQ